MKDEEKQAFMNSLTSGEVDMFHYCIDDFDTLYCAVMARRKYLRTYDAQMAQHGKYFKSMRFLPHNEGDGRYGASSEDYYGDGNYSTAQHKTRKDHGDWKCEHK